MVIAVMIVLVTVDFVIQQTSDDIGILYGFSVGILITQIGICIGQSIWDD